MLLWSKIICHLKITLPNHHPEDPYEVDQVFEGTKWVSKGTDTSTTKTSNGTSSIHLSLPIANPELETARNLHDISKILADFPGAFIESFLDAPLSPLTPTNSLFFPEAQSISSSPTNPFPLLNPTIANMNNGPVAWHARMPPRNDTTVPKWDESRPRELPQYFKELEYLFTDCGIADNMQKKEYAAQYISYDMAETWLGLPEFGDNIIIGNNAP
ncbi:hypothetical protein H2248_004191 [Termitomyces sp. 'cryptogamus']|nr:hypothetical protein H2248_004191 [Termitomyces sp. 'cryptogamus']